MSDFIIIFKDKSSKIYNDTEKTGILKTIKVIINKNFFIHFLSFVAVGSLLSNFRNKANISFEAGIMPFYSSNSILFTLNLNYNRLLALTNFFLSISDNSETFLLFSFA